MTFNYANLDMYETIVELDGWLNDPDLKKYAPADEIAEMKQERAEAVAELHRRNKEYRP